MKKNKSSTLIAMCLALFSVFSWSSIHAQEGGGLGLEAGVKAGAITSTLSSQKYIPVTGPMTSYSVGLFADYGVLDYLAASMEVLVSQTGGTNLPSNYIYAGENIVSDFRYNTAIKCTQISIPVYASYLFETKGKIVPRVYLGADFAFNVSKKAMNTTLLNAPEETYRITTYEKVGKRLNTFDWGPLAGTGFTVKGDMLSYYFDARYRMGMRDLNNTKSTYVNSKLIRSYYQISFGVTYSF
jgi:hypothetical protein